MHLSHFLLLFHILKIQSFKDIMSACIDLWLNSWRDTEELPCQSPQGLWRPSAPRQGSLGSKGALNLVILEANGRYQRLYINQGGAWRKTACWSKCQAKGTKFIINQRMERWKEEVSICLECKIKKIIKSKMKKIKIKKIVASK